MAIEIVEITREELARYAAVPIRYTVESIFRVELLAGGLGGLALTEERLETPYVKDYDRQGGRDTGPLAWGRDLDLRRWGLFLAVDAQRPVGAAAVALGMAGLNALEGRPDTAVFWDLRVEPRERGQGLGSRLFQHAAGWARGKGCRLLKVETQNVNVAACRFYAAQGCHLGQIHRYGYAGCPGVEHEVMLAWYLEL